MAQFVDKFHNSNVSHKAKPFEEMLSNLFEDAKVILIEDLPKNLKIFMRSQFLGKILFIFFERSRENLVKKRF